MQDALQEIEASIKEAQKTIELSNALERLQSNRDYRKIIREGYFEQEAIRLVHLKADPCMQSEASQKSIVAQMDAIGALMMYFRTILQQGELARKSMSASEEMRDELLNDLA